MDRDYIWQADYGNRRHLHSLQVHMSKLCETIGARPTGSAENKAATDYAFEVLQKCGFETYRQEFDCINWRNFGAKLLLDDKNIPVESAEYATPCDIQAYFICVGTLEELQRVELSGKILILHGDLCNEPLMPKNFEFWNPDEHKQIIALLEEKSPKAIITASTQSEHIIQDGDFNIPCAVINESELDAFLSSPNSIAKLIIDTERIPTRSCNVIASYGTGSDKVCLSAHIDTKPMTPGALDNASGVSALLALAEALAGKELSFRIEIVLLNGEDYFSNPGEIIFMQGLKSEYRMAVNVDGVGLKGSPTSISFYECEPQLENQIMKLIETIENFERVEPWPMGDHMIFAICKIPTIAITASEIFNLLETVIHSPEDDLGNIDFDVLGKIVQLLIDCLETKSLGVLYT